MKTAVRERFAREPFIQVAGILDLEEARMVEGAGAVHLGFPLRLDVHAPDLTEEEAREVVGTMADPSRAVLITYLSEADEILGLARFLGVGGVQLHGPVAPEQLVRLRESGSDLLLIKSLVVRWENEEKLLLNVERLSPMVDGFITDTFDPTTGASGATGKVHDWSVSRRLAKASSRPVILAGGLGPDNVEEAVRVVRPAGVDAHTGLEKDSGRKNPEAVRAFIRRAAQALYR